MKHMKRSTFAFLVASALSLAAPAVLAQTAPAVPAQAANASPGQMVLENSTRILATLEARRAEFGHDVHQPGRIGDFHSRQDQETLAKDAGDPVLAQRRAGVADQRRIAAQVPGGAPVVAGLVVAAGGVFGDPALARLAPARDQVGAAAYAHEQQGGNAPPGDAEVVGAIVERALGMGVGGHGAVLAGGGLGEVLVEGILAGAHQHHVAAGPGGLQDVHGQVGGG